MIVIHCVKFYPKLTPYLDAIVEDRLLENKTLQQQGLAAI
jgi:hypothetical protein